MLSRKYKKTAKIARQRYQNLSKAEKQKSKNKVINATKSFQENEEMKEII